MSQIAINQLLNLLDDTDENAFSDIAFEVIQKLRILSDDLLCGSEQCIQPVSKLLTLNNLLYEGSFESFKGIKLLDSISYDFLDATADQEVHTERQSRSVVLDASETATNMRQYTGWSHDDARVSGNIPGMKLRDK